MTAFTQTVTGALSFSGSLSKKVNHRTIISALQWSEALRCRERSLQWTPDYGHAASPPALDGTQQYGSSNGGGLWRCTLNGVQLRSTAQIKAWLALEIQLRGGKVPIDVPLFLWVYQPKPVVGASVDIAAVGGWAARAIGGTVVLNDADGLEPGQHFSDYDATIYGWRMHRIESVSAVGGQPTQRYITFWPPARFAVADTHALEFDEPRCVMRLAGSGSMDLDLDLRKRGNPNAELVEAF